MYNIHNHYTNIYSLAQSIAPESTAVYLHPFGSSGIENIEILGNCTEYPEDDFNAMCVIPGAYPRSGPVFIFYDQEPLLVNYNRDLLSHVRKKYAWGLHRYAQFHQDVILVNTETDSDEKDAILNEHSLKDCYYFHHAFAASDWFRGYKYLHDLTPISGRTLTKKFITFNRITSNARIYRSLLVNELVSHSLLDQGHVSFSKLCPNGTDFANELRTNAPHYNLSTSLVDTAIHNITEAKCEFRIDFKDQQYIPNNSFHMSAIKENMESFVHVVTETCYWGRKKHLTEKIFKPIVMRQPFVLVGCAHNLDYLKSYGFKTFDRWWDESYDTIEDDVERMHAIGQVLADICQNDLDRLKEILLEMEEVLEHNYRWFYNPEFLNNCWSELVTNLSNAIKSTP